MRGRIIPDFTDEPASLNFSSKNQKDKNTSLAPVFYAFWSKAVTLSRPSPFSLLAFWPFEYRDFVTVMMVLIRGIAAFLFS